PILSILSLGCRLWVPAFAGTTKFFARARSGGGDDRVFFARARSGLRAAFQPRVALLDERLELGLLRGEAVGVARFIARARHGRRLLDQLADIVARDGDAVVDLVERQDAEVGHWAVSADELTDCLTAAGARQKPPALPNTPSVMPAKAGIQ